MGLTHRAKSKATRRERDSHLYLEPHRVWQRVMGVVIDKPAWDAIQRTHFTYWYMGSVARSGGTST